jgi:hypothetical protein
MTPQQRLVLVTGCARSATRYTTFVLRRLGLDIRHERLGKDGVASWCLVPDAVETPWGPSSADVTFDVVLHQVRHPLAVISSVATLKDSSWRFIYEHVPVSPSHPLLLRAAAYWYHWNAAAERKATLTYRVENIRNELPEICTLLRVRCDLSILDRVPSDVNTRRAGRLFHLAEEALERVHADPPRRLRSLVARPGRGPSSIGWNDLRALDAGLCDAVLAKARDYGYDA